MGNQALRPRRVGEILDASIKLCLGNARVLMGASAAVIVKALSDAYLGQPTSIGASLRFGLRRLLPLIALGIIYAIGQVFAFILLVIPGRAVTSRERCRRPRRAAPHRPG